MKQFPFKLYIYKNSFSHHLGIKLSNIIVLKQHLTLKHIKYYHYIITNITHAHIYPLVGTTLTLSQAMKNIPLKPKYKSKLENTLIIGPLCSSLISKIFKHSIPSYDKFYLFVEYFEPILKYSSALYIEKHLNELNPF